MASDLDMYTLLRQRGLTGLLAAVRDGQLYLRDAHTAAIEGVTTLEGARMRRVGKSVTEVRAFEERLLREKASPRTTSLGHRQGRR